MNKETKSLLKEQDQRFKNNPFASQSFLIDGYRVTIEHRFFKNKLLKLFFVNGVNHSADWYNTQSRTEIELRFGYRVEKQIYPKKAIDAAKVGLKKKKISDSTKNFYNDVINTKTEQYKPFTGATITAIVTQWYNRELNKSIEVLDSEGNIIHKIK